MPLPTYLMSNFPSVRPSLNLQFDSQPTPEDMTSHLASVGATFSRASIGTYTDANGLIQEASAGQARPNYSTVGVHEGLLIEESRTNLAESSEDFSTTGWGTSNINITTNQIIAPDGTASADKTSPTTNQGTVYQGVTLTAFTTYTCSAFLKKAENDFGMLRIQWDGTTYDTVNFDLANGTTSRTPSGVDSVSIEDVGNGWYRCIVTFTPSANITTNFQIRTSSQAQTGTSGSYTGTFNGTNGIYAWGAQFEEGSFPTSYIPTIPTFSSRASTATYFDSSGVLQTQAIQTSPTGVGRTDHKYIDGQWVEAGLLLEAESVNYAKASEDLDNTTYWDFNNVTVSTDTETDPKGGTNSFLLAETAITGTHYIGIDASHRPSVTSGETWTYSIFVKKGDGANAPDIIQVATNSFFNTSLYANFNISSGTVTDSNLCDASIEQYGDWYRIIVTMESSGTGDGNVVLAFCDDNPTASRLPSYAGQTDADVFVWGAQLEEQSQATSYIPTTTAEATRAEDVYTTATKTRSADVCYIDGTAFTDFYNQEQGTWFLNTSVAPSGGSGGLLFPHNTSNATGTRTVAIVKISSDDNIDFAFGGSYTGDIITTDEYDIDAFNKFAISIIEGDVDVYSNGSSAYSASRSINENLNKVFIGAWQDGTIPLNASMKKLIYFPRKLDNNELIKLTQ